jgi:hypothetical protein
MQERSGRPLHFLSILAFLVSWAFTPAQIRTVSRITMEKQQACSGLSTERCCEQMVAYSSYRATGDQLSKRAALAIGLRCRDKARLASTSSCKNIAFARGLSAKVVKRLCEPADIKKKCEKNQFCSQCSAELIELSYSEPHSLCYAATYDDDSLRSTIGPIVVELPAEPSDLTSDGTAIVIKKRHLLR